MRKTVSWFEISKWPSHWQLSATCLSMLRPAILFVWQCFFALSKLNSHSHETSKKPNTFNTISQSYASWNWFETGTILKTVERSYCMLRTLTIVALFRYTIASRTFDLSADVRASLQRKQLLAKLAPPFPEWNIKWNNIYLCEVIEVNCKKLQWSCT